jgi:cyclopropane fatty-acyl-phospholipid synthase-like methyltransferase
LQPASFDSYALTYDDHFTGSLIGKAQRDIVHTYLGEHLFDHLNVLEVNCGTGEDAVFIAPKCKSLLATDASSQMVQLAKQKAASFKNTEVKHVAIQELSQRIPEKFTTIFSDFGGLNCLSPSEMKQFSRDCSILGDDAAELMLVIMGRKCRWERFYFTLKGDKEKQNRRKSKQGVKTVINGSEFLTYYYSPSEIKDIFKEEFNFIDVRPVGIFIPPSYLEPFFSRHKVLFSFLKWLDKLFRNNSSLSDQADHYIIHLMKK